MNLAARLRAIEPGTGRSAWPGHEHGRGYGVLALPFDSGHLLGLRVFPRNDFAPYVSVWHRPPEGAWAIYVDGPALDAACPRYWGPAVGTSARAAIDVRWTGPRHLAVSMDEPALEWALELTAPPLLRTLNGVEARLPRWTWRVARLRRLREWVARRYLGYGDVDLAFTAASGHEVLLLARENYRVEASTARLDGRSLGDPVVLEETPTVGGVALLRAPSFVVGEAHARILDPVEHRRTRERLRQA